MIERIAALRAELDNITASDKNAVEELRIKYLGKKGLIPALMADFRNVPAESKKEVGRAVNELKEYAQSRISELKESFDSQDSEVSADFDLTRTATPTPCGTRH